MSISFFEGPDFLVNTTTMGDQRAPTITVLADGRFVIAWTDMSQSSEHGSSTVIRGQIFTAAGQPSGPEFRIDPTPQGSLSLPTITALLDGRFVLAWADSGQNGPDTSLGGVYGQIFTAGGLPSGSQFLVNTAIRNRQTEPTITMLEDGRFVVAWMDWSRTGADISNAAVRGQIFTPDGRKSGPEFLINTATEGTQAEPTITGSAGGGFVVAWMDWSRSADDPSFNAIRGQMFTAAGAPSGSEFLINTTIQGSQFQPTITGLEGDRFVVAWTDGSGTSGGGAIRGQIYEADGTPAGSEFLINTTTSGSQNTPAITALDAGRFVVSWSGDPWSGGNTTLYGQIFADDGTPAGSEFLINTPARGRQSQPTIIGLADGRFVVAWTDDSQAEGDTSGTAIRAQIFDAGSSQDGVARLGTPGNDSLTGTRHAEALFGLAGNDTLTGGLGNDTFHGGSGTDRAVFGVASGSVNALAGPSSILLISAEGVDVVSNDIEFLQFTDRILTYAEAARLVVGAPVSLIDGTDLDNVLDGTAGPDLIRGFGGNDTLTPGAGPDTIEGGDGADMVSFADLAQRVMVDLAAGRAVSGANTDVLSNVENVTGTLFDDLITGDDHNNLISGLDGDDVMVGSRGLDTFDGGLGRDTVTYASAPSAFS